MKAIILAAGKGSRISGITDGNPKSLLEFGDTTLIGHSLKLFAEAGIKEIIVATGYRRHDIMKYVNNEWEHELKFAFNPHFESTNVLYSFWLASAFLDDSDFLFLHADTVFSGDVLKSLIDYDKNSEVVFAVDRHPCEEEEMKVQFNEKGQIKLVNKEMPSSSADGEFLGLARINHSQLKAIRNSAETLFEQKQFLAFFEVAIQDLIDKNNLSVDYCDVTGMPWREVDFIEDYEAACKLFFRDK